MKAQSKLTLIRREEIPHKSRHQRPLVIMHCSYVNKGKRYPYMPAAARRAMLKPLLEQLRAAGR